MPSEASKYIPFLDPNREAGQFMREDIRDRAVTKSKIGFTSVAITVAAATTSGSSAADSTLVGGEIVGIYPTGNQDQFVDNVVLNADGSITVTLAAAATAANTFKVFVLKP